MTRPGSHSRDSGAGTAMVIVTGGGGRVPTSRRSAGLCVAARCEQGPEELSWAHAEAGWAPSPSREPPQPTARTPSRLSLCDYPALCRPQATQNVSTKTEAPGPLSLPVPGCVGGQLVPLIYPLPPPPTSPVSTKGNSPQALPGTWVSPSDSPDAYISVQGKRD